MAHIRGLRPVSVAICALGFVLLSTSAANAYDYPFYEKWEVTFVGARGVCGQDDPVDYSSSFILLLGLDQEGDVVKSILTREHEGWRVTGSWIVYSGTAPGIVFGLGRYQGDELFEAYQFKGNQTSDTSAHGTWTQSIECPGVNQSGSGTWSATRVWSGTNPGELSNEPPTASFTYSPDHPVAGQRMTFDSSSSSDPDGTIVSYSWKFGDGGTGNGKVATHVYDESREYTVTLTVTDDDGLQDTLSKVVTVVKTPVLLVHGWPEFLPGPPVWNDMIPYLEENGYVRDLSLFDIDFTGDDIERFAQQVIDRLRGIRRDPEGPKVDIVAYSMGGLASRWCIQRLAGREHVNKLIMLGTPNHGFPLFPPWASPYALDQMYPESDFLAELNYDEPHFNASTWHIRDDRVSSGYTVLAGSGQCTWEVFWNTYPGNEGIRELFTNRGDGLVGVRSAMLTNANMPVPCYQYDVRHEGMPRDAEIMQDVIHLLNSEPVEHGVACEPSPRNSYEPSLWQKINIARSELILKGAIKTFELIMEYGVPIAEIGVGYAGSELDLTLMTPSGIVIDPAYASSNPNVDFTYNSGRPDYFGNTYDEKYYTISNPGGGTWIIRVKGVDTPAEGERFSLGAVLKGDSVQPPPPETNISWIRVADGCPGAWHITPAAPSTSDVIDFSGPTAKTFSNSCVAQVEMGVPRLAVNSASKTIQLSFEPMPPGTACPTLWDPVCGLEGSFGPLEVGRWHFFSQHPSATFEIWLDVEGTVVPVYRFWSGKNARHFYTINESEKNKLVNQYSDVWTYECVAYYAFPAQSEARLAPVYRFWSGANQSHFYTISESEKNKLVGKYSNVWAYEGPAFYAFPEGQQPAGTKPLYRFWSPASQTHFYTISESEKNKLIDRFSDAWTYEGVVWYVY
jgi:PKD repeat protein